MICREVGRPQRGIKGSRYVSEAPTFVLGILILDQPVNVLDLGRLVSICWDAMQDRLTPDSLKA